MCSSDIHIYIDCSNRYQVTGILFWRTGVCLPVPLCKRFFNPVFVFLFFFSFLLTLSPSWPSSSVTRHLRLGCLNQNVMEVVFPRSKRKNGAGKALPYRDPFRFSYKPYWVPES